LIVDAYGRRMAGWSMREDPTADPVVGAIREISRHPPMGVGLVRLSTNGGQPHLELSGLVKLAEECGHVG